MTPPHFLTDITFLSFKNVNKTYAKLNDNSFLFFKNDLGIYAKLLIFMRLRLSFGSTLKN